MKSPRNFGVLNSKFSDFREEQLETALKIAFSNKRFVILEAPPGWGKSLIYSVAANMMHCRALILTVTKALQDQLRKDFTEFYSIKGMSNYECLEFGGRCNNAPCMAGDRCELKNNGCMFFDGVREAIDTTTVISNYAFRANSVSLGDFDLLICDEGDSLFDTVSMFLSLELQTRQMRYYGIKEFPEVGDKINKWLEFLDESVLIIEQYRLHGGKSEMISRESLTLMLKIKDTADMIRKNRRNWVISEMSEILGSPWVRAKRAIRDYTIKISPIWVKKYLEKVIFHGVEKVLIVSATMSKESLKLLGVKESDSEYIKIGATKEKGKDRNFFYKPTRRIKYNMDESDFSAVMEVIDEIIESRYHDRKGIIQCQSFAWRDRILEASKFRDLMITNDRNNLTHIVEKFRKSYNSILISPSISTGYDFPGDDCRYNIIFKTPFLDMRNPIIARRCKDTTYNNITVSGKMVQMVGRSLRSKEDWSETFLLDSYFQHLYANNRQFFSVSFRKAFKLVRAIPKPPNVRRS